MLARPAANHTDHAREERSEGHKPVELKLMEAATGTSNGVAHNYVACTRFASDRHYIRRRREAEVRGHIFCNTDACDDYVASRAEACEHITFGAEACD